MANLYVDDGYVNKGYIQTGITIDWGTGVIFVPRSELTLVQQLPTIIYTLDLNFFRLTLKDLEDDAEGMPYTITHIHNTEVTLGGLTYARVIEIVEPYTVTFEDGQYAVNLIGANSNVGDRVNVNQVSVRSANSAGMTSSPDIEYSSFNGAVHVDITSSNEGTVFPIGTPRAPVNNITDAVLIDALRGFGKLHIHSSMVGSNAMAGSSLNNFTIVGDSAINTNIEIVEDLDCIDLTIKNCNIFGILDGGTHIIKCNIGNINYVNGQIADCGLYGDILLAGGEEAVLTGCYVIDQDSIPTIDMGGSGQDLVLTNYNGIINIKNLTSVDEEIGIGLSAGMVVLEDTITAGTIIISGIGLLYDYTTGTANVNSDGLMNRTQDAYQGRVYIDVNTTNSGSVYPVGLKNSHAVNNIDDALIIADKYNCSELFFLSSITLASGINVSNFSLTANKSRIYELEFDSNVMTTNTEVANLQVTGVCGCAITFDNCIINNLIEMCGIYDNCYFSGYNSCADLTTKHVLIKNSRSLDRLGAHLATNSAKVTIQGWVSKLYITDKVGIEQVNINSVMAMLIVESSCVAGEIHLSGIAYYTDNSDVGCTVITDKLTNTDIQAAFTASAVWDELLINHVVSGSAGDILANGGAGGITPAQIAEAVWDDPSATGLIADVSFIKDIEGGRWKIVDNQMLFYKDENEEYIIASFDLYNGDGVPAEDNIYERKRVQSINLVAFEDGEEVLMESGDNLILEGG